MLLQSDLRNLEHWSSVFGLTFNEKKCKQQRITRKITPVTSTYMINDHQLNTTDTERDLGVYHQTLRGKCKFTIRRQKQTNC